MHKLVTLWKSKQLQNSTVSRLQNKGLNVRLGQVFEIVSTNTDEQFKWKVFRQINI
jgi:hypothetical protein